MKKTISVLMFFAGVASAAFNDTTWSFENTLEGTGTHEVSASNVKYGKANAWNESTVTYEDTNMAVGTKVGDYYLTKELGKAVILTDGCYLRVQDVYWTNQEGKLGTVSQMLYQDKADGSGKEWQVDSVNTYTNSYTLMAWVKFDDLSDNKKSQAIFGTGTANDSGMSFTLMDNKYIDLCAKGVADNKSDSLTLAANTWYNIAVTYDCTTKTANFYLNGKLVSTDTTVSNYHYAGNNWSAIGAKYYAGDGTAADVLDGSIAEFKILGGAYTQEQILKAAHLSSKPIPEPTTATLSLLALAGLAARRRRR